MLSFVTALNFQAKFYDDVIEDVISGVKDEFVEDGGDIQILEELKKVLHVSRLTII